MAGAQNFDNPSDAPEGMALAGNNDKPYEEIISHIEKLFDKLDKRADKLFDKAKATAKELKAAGEDKNQIGAGRLGLGSFTRGEKIGMGLGLAAFGSATYMSMAPNTMAAVTQRMANDTYAGFSGMSSRQALVQANSQVRGGATSAMGPTMAAMNLMYSGGYTANSLSSKNIMSQLGGLSAMTGMSNEAAAASVAGINGMSFLRAGIQVRDRNGNLKPPNQIVNDVYNFLYRGQKITKQQAALIMNPGSKGYQTLMQITGGDQALMQTIQSGIMARASNGKPLTASQMSDPNKMLDAMGVDKSSPIRSNFRFNSSENRKLQSTEQGLVGGYNVSLRTTAALNDAYSTMADILGPVNQGLMTLKGILQTMPNAGNMGGTVSGLAGGAMGLAKDYLGYKMMGRFLGSKGAGTLAKGGKSFLSKAFSFGKKLLNPKMLARMGLLAAEEVGVAAEEVGTAGLATPAAVAEEAAIAAQAAAMFHGGPHDHGNLGTGSGNSGDSASAAHVLPVPKGTPITSHFGPRSVKSTNGVGSTNHKGTDFGVKEGSPVYSFAAGTVVETGSGGGYGNYVVVQHADGTKSRYAHLKAILVSKNQKLKAGQQVGRSGGKPGTPGAGNSTGPHLHLEVTNKAGVKVNPEPYLTGAGSTHSAAPTPTPSAKNFLSGKNTKAVSGGKSLSDYSSPTLGTVLGDKLDSGDAVSWQDIIKRVPHSQLKSFIASIPEYDGPITGNKKDLIKTIAGKGFHGKALETAYAISIAESGGRSQAVGDVKLQDEKWGPSIGLFQIRSLKDWKKYSDPYRDASRLPNPNYNAEAAFKKSKQGTNFGPWSTYTSGSFLKHLGEAAGMAKSAGVGGGTDQVNLGHAGTEGLQPSMYHLPGSGSHSNQVVINLNMKVYIAQGSVAEADRMVRLIGSKLKNDNVLKSIASVL